MNYKLINYEQILFKNYMKISNNLNDGYNLLVI